MRVLIDAVGQHAALVEADIARRSADQAGNRVFLHVFRHVEAQQLHPERIGQLFGHLGLAHAGRPGEEVVADGLLRLAQAGARQLDRARQRLDRLVLAEHHALEGLLQILEHLGIVLGDILRRDAGDLGDHRLDLLGADGLAPLALGQQMLRRAGLVDHVDGLVGQLAVVDVARRKLYRRLDRVGGVFHPVMFLEIGLQPLEDLHRVLDRGFVHVDLLEPARQRAVLLEMLAEFLVGGGAHGAQLAALQRGFQKVRGIHRPAAGGAGADHGMDLVDEQHRVGVILQLVDHGLQPFLEIAAIAGPGQERAHVQRIDRGLGQHLGHLALDDLARQTFRDGGLADAGIAHQQRVVLAPAAQHLDTALDLFLAADQRVDRALARFRVQVDAVFSQRAFLLLRLGGGAVNLFLGLGRALNRARFSKGGILGHTMGDEIHRVIAGHVLFLQEVGGVRFPLGKDRDQHIGAGHLGAARALHMDRGALDHALERGGRNRLGTVDIGDQVGQILVDEIDKGIAQFAQIDATGLHDAGGVGFIQQRQQQMLQRCEFMSPVIGQRQCGVDGLFKGARE